LLRRQRQGSRSDRHQRLTLNSLERGLARQEAATAMLPAFLPCLYRDGSPRESPGTRPEAEVFGQINP
jgi:hypothetical protein